MLLLVDDNKINLQVRESRLFSWSVMTDIWLTLAQLLCALASKDRYQYDTAANGLEALRAFQNAQIPYDIVFMGKQTRLYTGAVS